MNQESINLLSELKQNQLEIINILATLDHETATDLYKKIDNISKIYIELIKTIQDVDI